jgi:hypothetical protein
MKRRVTQFAARGLVMALAALPCAARACDACMGGKDPNLRPATNGAIFFMLGIVGMMAGLVGLFMRYLSKRARMPLAPHEQLIQMMTIPERPNHV